MFALVDANSFYCSCERAFNPKLRNKPLVVLSNNDGCVISLTHEAKDLGLKMGEPWHLAKKRPEFKSVIAHSSNYALYGDMSRRMYEVIAQHSKDVEVYSIDEMFAYLFGLEIDYVEWGTEVRKAIRRDAKMPNCVGIGPTKTIAKGANAWAKMDRSGSGVCDLSDEDVRKEIYKSFPLEKVWGLGKASRKKLNALDVYTVADFLKLPEDLVRKTLTITGSRTMKELQGIQCHAFSLSAPTKKSLACTRSFGRAITEWEEMRQAIVTYVTRAAEKMRRHNLVGVAMQVFMHTNRFNGDPSYANQITFQFEPTDDTNVLINVAVKAGKSIFKDGYRYSKAGIVFVDLFLKEEAPRQLFSSVDPVKSSKLMTALDSVNAKYGRNSLTAGGILSQGGKWSMKRESLSPCYTTQFEDLLQVKAT